MFIFTSFLTLVILRHALSQYDISGRISQFPDLNSSFDVPTRNKTSDYDITKWVEQLHLQQCAIVEIGEGFCAIFVELRDTPTTFRDTYKSEVREYFLGLCSCATIRTWSLCPDELTKQRKSDCIFTEANPYSYTSARVHRRFCDVTLLRRNAPPCDCGNSIAGKRLFATQGFPTCFMNPLPESLCYPRGVCGVAQCFAETVNGIHSPKCDPDCHLKQPFCEDIDSYSSVPPKINSAWTNWSAAECNATCVAVSTCHDQVTGEPAIDCIGPGSFCCPESLSKCYCEVRILDGIMRASRFTEACASAEGCRPTDPRTFTFEGVLLPPNGIDSNELYDSGDRERFEESIGPTRRLLRSWYPQMGQTLHRLTRNTAVRDFYRNQRQDDEDDEVEEEEDEDENLNDEGEVGEVEDEPSQGEDSEVAEGEAEEGEEEDGKEETVNDEDPGALYYDYDASASTTSSPQVTLVATVNLLIAFFR